MCLLWLVCCAQSVHVFYLLVRSSPKVDRAVAEKVDGFMKFNCLVRQNVYCRTTLSVPCLIVGTLLVLALILRQVPAQRSLRSDHMGRLPSGTL